MKLWFLGLLILPMMAFAQNVEITAKYEKDNENFIYMTSDSKRYKLKKSELTPEGIEQILNNKEVTLTMFVPPKAITKEQTFEKKDKARK